ncbi:MAG: AsmA family protein [Pseudomonadota bacterium]
MRFLGGSIIFIVLLVGIALLVAALVPASSYRGRIQEEASNAVGRTVTLGEKIDFRIWPRIGFHVTDLEVQNPDGFEPGTLLSVAEADIGVDLPALFNKRISISTFVLTQPKIALIKQADGAVNWSIGGESETAQSDDGGQPSNQDAAGSNSQQVPDLSLGDVRIVDGSITYTDKMSGVNYEAVDVDAVASLTSSSEPLEARGEMLFQGTPTSFDLVLTTISSLQNGNAANVKTNGSIGGSSFGADMEVSLSEGNATFSGPINVNIPDLSAFASVFDADLEDAPGFDRLLLTGDAQGNASQIAFDNVELTFDEIVAFGDMTMDLSGSKPRAKGALRTEVLDLRPYLPPAPADQAQGFPAWSEAPLNLNSLRNIDADFELTAGKILINNIQTGRSQLSISLTNGRMTAELPQLQVYEGGGSGRVIVDASKSIPTMSGFFDFRSIQAQPMSRDLLNLDRLLGVGSFRIEFAAAGDSQAAIMRSLDGEGGFDLSDGALKGLNLAKLATGVKSLFDGGGLEPASLASLVSGVRSDTEETEFTEFITAFTMDDGLMSIPSISLAGPLIRMTGNGQISLPEQTLALRLSPSIPAGTAGAGGTGFTAPLKVGGTFSEPSFSIDAEALLTNRVQNEGRQLLERALGLEEDTEGSAEAGEGDVARSLLRGILGGASKDPDESGGLQNQR